MREGVRAVFVVVDKRRRQVEWGHGGSGPG